MSVEKWQQAKEIFGRAIELPAAARDEFVDHACEGDRELRRQISKLLSADRAAGSFLDRPLDPTVPLPTIDGYRLIRQAGAGGMSRVYLAVQRDRRFERRVAIKMLKRSSATRDDRRRLERERQILASLDHPNIARLYDAGTTADGWPYVVMEWVEGEPITAYCDRHRATVDERIELFRTVCDAVHFAHQNLIVHRDLKPGNILVTAEASPKLLDFGIAKILNPELGVPGQDPTVPWRRLLTPEVASPEQIAGRPVTTASDVYALGVLLYELCTGTRPFRFDGMSPAEVERTVAEVHPPPPSEAAAAAGAGAGHRRSLSTAQLARRLAGDIDTIVGKALRKSPRRRFRSAAELAEDLRRHRVGLPVIARRPTYGYRLGRFLRRNRLAVAVASAFVLLLAASAAGLGLLTVRLASERQQAEAERDKARQVVRFVEDIFAVADPDRDAAADPTARVVLDHAARRIGEDLGQQPALRAALMRTIGVIYTRLGRHGEARHQLGGALDLLSEAPDAGALQLAGTLADLALAQVGDGASDAAAGSLRQALDALAAAGDGEPIERASILGRAGTATEQLGRFGEAERLGRAALELRLAHLDPHSLEVAESRYMLAGTLMRLGRFEDSEAQHRRALAVRRELLGADHPRVAASLNDLAITLKQLGRYAEAEQLIEEALAVLRRRLGPAHPDTLAALTNLASLATYTKDFDVAARRYAEALESASASLGDGHPNLSFLMLGLGRARSELGDAAGAEPVLRQALEIRRRAFPPGSHLTAVAEAILGDCLLRLERYDEAEALLTSSHRVIAALEPHRNRLVYSVLKDLAELYRQLAREDLAAGFEAEMAALRAENPTLGR